MAWTPDDPLLWGGVFLLVFIVEVLIILNLRAQRAGATYEPAGRQAVLHEGEELTDVLSRFVVDADGERIGETVGMDGDLVIVKAATEPVYRAIPRSALARTDDGFRVAGEVDGDEAARRGAEWRERQHRVVSYDPDELPEDERPQ